MTREEKGAVMKKGLIIGLVAVLVVAALAGCGSSAKSSSKAGSDSQASAPAQQEKKDFSNMSVGDSATLDNGLTVSVLEVKDVQQQYTNDPQKCVTVSYANDGNDSVSYNLFDWKSENADGVERSVEMAMGDDNALDSGKLKAGGKITGNIYFKPDAAKVYYYSNFFKSESEICWNI